MFDDIADADDAGQSAIGNNGQMSNTVPRHQSHCACDAVLGGNSNYCVGHHLPNSHQERLLAVFGESADNIAFRYDAANWISAFDNESGNTVKAHPFRSILYSRRGGDLDHLGTFTIENTLNAHDKLAFVSGAGTREGLESRINAATREVALFQPPPPFAFPARDSPETEPGPLPVVPVAP